MNFFQAPQPAEPWEGIRDALKEGDVAPQTGIFANNTYAGDEDCLFINVFTPKVDWSSSQLTPNSVEIVNLHFKLSHGGKFIYIHKIQCSNTNSLTSVDYNCHFFLS